MAILNSYSYFLFLLIIQFYLKTIFKLNKLLKNLLNYDHTFKIKFNYYSGFNFNNKSNTFLKISNI